MNQTEQEAVRELRQRRAYYRCCIPALAGFVSLRSIAPDGSIQMDQLDQDGNVFLALCRIAIVFEFMLISGTGHQVRDWRRSFKVHRCLGFLDLSKT